MVCQKKPRAAAAAAGLQGMAEGHGQGQSQGQGPGTGHGRRGGGRRRAELADSAMQEDQCHPRKIFVGGLAHRTNTQDLREYFERFGTVADAVVLRWPDGRSRGFGYVTFGEVASASAALTLTHRVGGREVDVKRAVPGTNKIFVGGLPQSTPASELREHFEAYGVVSDAVVMIDPCTNRSRGFGFVCFLPGQEGASAVAAALDQYQNHHIRGKWIEVKSAASPHKLAAVEGQDEEALSDFLETCVVSLDSEPQKVTVHVPDVLDILEDIDLPPGLDWHCGTPVRSRGMPGGEPGPWDLAVAAALAASTLLDAGRPLAMGAGQLQAGNPIMALSAAQAELLCTSSGRRPSAISELQRSLEHLLTVHAKHLDSHYFLAAESHSKVEL